MTEKIQKQVSIADFLLKDVTVLEEKKELIFPQFQVPWIIRSLGADEFTSLRKSATRKVRSKSGQLLADTDQERLGDLILAAAVVQPELDNPELQEFYGTVGDAAATARKMLKIGQYVDLQETITELNGFDDSVDELEDELKK